MNKYYDFSVIVLIICVLSACVNHRTRLTEDIGVAAVKMNTLLYRDSISGQILCVRDTIGTNISIDDILSVKSSSPDSKQQVVLYFANEKQLKDQEQFMDIFRKNGGYRNCKTWIKFVGNDTILSCMSITDVVK